MSNIRAILTTNNAYDTLLLANGTALTMTKDIFSELKTPGVDITAWQGNDDWTQHGDDIEIAAKAFGNVFAHVTNEDIFVDFLGVAFDIKDEKKFDERVAFYGV